MISASPSYPPEKMDINDIKCTEKMSSQRFRPRPSSSGNSLRATQPQRRNSEKQLSQRRQRLRAASATTSSPKKSGTSKTLTSRQKHLSTMDCRSVVSADDWGGGSSGNSCNLSYTDILGQKSFREVVGGEKHANEVLASHDRRVETVMKEQQVKEGRRSNVKNSLATFLQSNDSDEDSITVEEEEMHEVDDEHLISDADDDEDEMDLRDSSSARSPKKPTPKRIDSVGSKSSRRVTRTTRTFDKEQSSGGNNSNHSRKCMARPRPGVRRIPSKAVSDSNPKSRSRSTATSSNRRVQRVRRNTADSGDEASVDASSRRSRRGTSRVRSGVADDADDKSVTSSHRNRTSVRPRSVDASVRRNRSRSRGPEQQRVPQRRRSQSRSRGDDDDRSVSSKVSHATASRRGRRPGKGPQPKKNLLPPSQHTGTKDPRGKDPTSPPSSPENNKNYVSRSMPSLDSHFDSQRDQKRMVESDMVSEASSSHFSSGTPQSTLLQFDPTSADLIQAVSQKEAKKTSETFKHADGTESKFQISELAGLPTFEKPMTAEEIEALNASTQSLDISVAISEEEEDRQQSKLMGTHLRSAVFGKTLSNLQTQNPGEASNEPIRRAPRTTKSSSALQGPEPPNRRGNIQATKSMSFMQRVQNRKSQFQETMMNRSTRVIGMDHQALLEDESEHD